MSNSNLNSNSKMYSVEEIAYMFNLQPSTIREYIKSGELKGYSIGKAYLVSESQLQEYLDAHKTYDDQPQPDPPKSN